MFSRYYQSELAYLREMGREYGLRHPGLAESLTERGTDPDVERLLEGFAFMAARIRERSEAAVPELAEPLAELIAPHTLRGIPAATNPMNRGIELHEQNGVTTPSTTARNSPTNRPFPAR